MGVLDSGIDASHPHLEGQVVAWKDFAGDRTEPADLNKEMWVLIVQAQ